MEFPAWAEWAAGWLGGCKWPDVDLEAMRRLGDAWLRAADDIEALLPALDEALGQSMSHNKGDSSAAFSGRASELRESAARLEQLCRAMGTQFKDAATEIEYAQMMILATLAVVVVSIVRLVTALWAGGITAAAVAARLAQQRMRITLIYRQLLQAMVRYAAVDFATGAGLSMAVQGIQAFQGNRGRIDLGKAAMEGFQEAMESVVQSLTQGALNRRGTPGAAGIADAGRMLLLRSAGHSAFSGATGGAAAAAVMGFITGQPVSLEDMARAGVSQSVIGTATDIRELITPFDAGPAPAAPSTGSSGPAGSASGSLPSPAGTAAEPPSGPPRGTGLSAAPVSGVTGHAAPSADPSSGAPARTAEPAPAGSPPAAQQGPAHGSPTASATASSAPAASPSAPAQPVTAAHDVPGAGAAPGAVARETGQQTYEGEVRREAERPAERLPGTGLRVDLDGMHPEAARASAAAVRRLAERYPVEGFRHFRAVNFAEDFAHIPGADTQPAVAVTSGERRGVYINRRQFADPAGVVARAARDEETGRTVPGGGTVEGIVHHEYGHQLAEGLLGDPALRAELDRAVSRVLRMRYDAGDFHDDPAIRTEVEWHLSSIGAADPHEMIAEAFTEFHNAERPRPLATAIGRLIDRRLSRDAASRPGGPAESGTREREEVHARDAFSPRPNDADGFWVDVALEAFHIGEDRAAAARNHQWVRWEEGKASERELVIAAGLDDLAAWREFQENGRAVPPDHPRWRDIRKGHDYVYGTLRNHFGRTHEELYPEGEGARTAGEGDRAGSGARPSVAEPSSPGAGVVSLSTDAAGHVRRAEEKAEAAARRGEFVSPLNDPALPNDHRLVQRQIQRTLRHLRDTLTDAVDAAWAAGMEHVKKARPDLHRSDVHFAGPAKDAAMTYAREELAEWFAGHGPGLLDGVWGYRVRGGVHYDRRGREVEVAADGRLPLHKRIGAVRADVVIERTVWDTRLGERWIPAHIMDMAVRTEDDIKQRGRVKDRLGLSLFPKGISPTGYAPPNEYAAGRVAPPRTDDQWKALSEYVITNLGHHVDNVVIRETREPLYRVDNRGPDQLKETGFLAKDIHDADLDQHLGAGNRAFVSTSRNPVMPWRGKYQYELDLEGGVDADRTVGSELYGGHQQEVAIPGGFPFKHVRRFRVMLNEEAVGNHLAEPEYGPWHDNPDYEPP
ncbi:WXG100-like domain-containing protein [Nonomuraea sp. KM88]|uniref:WXG100-like domain-containing protein n=1 Tax=Nonomuraea sp. KM88 TaxID=3457427 RepID=UPI003FCC8931